MDECSLYAGPQQSLSPCVEPAGISKTNATGRLRIWKSHGLTNACCTTCYLYALRSLLNPSGPQFLDL